MLKIKSYIQQNIEDIFSDAYIPLKIRFGKFNALNEHLTYWQCGDNRNIIEVGIKEKSKELYSITLVNFCNAQLEEYGCSLKPIIDEDSCPIFEFDVLENYNVEEASIKIYIGFDSVSVIFAESDVISAVKSGDIIFYIDRNKNWVGFKMKINNECYNNLLKQIQG